MAGDATASVCLYDNQTRDWESALTYCENLILPPGGYTDWRLPDVKELRSIVDNSRYDPAIYTEFFPGTETDYYWWTSSSFLWNDSAWFVAFYNGYTYINSKMDAYYARCVR